MNEFSVPRGGHENTDKPWQQQRAQAAAQFAARGACLTPFREAVLLEIACSAQPLGAYEIAARLGSALGKTVAPNSVYRVLEVLMDCAVVRRIESRQAYCLADPAAGAGSVLLMCEGCGAVEAIEASAIAEAVDLQTRAAHFRPLRKVMEVTGICQVCDETRKGPD